MADKTKRKLLVLDSVGYARPFEAMFDELIIPKTTEELMNGIKACTTILFTGGEDVSPHLYGEICGSRTSANPLRDRFEQMVWKLGQEQEKSFLGICRGLQFIHVMCGGKLIQDTTSHAGSSHLIHDIWNNRCLMTSVHHQMVRPETVENNVVVAWSSARLSQRYHNGDDKDIYPEEALDAFKEPEIVWYPKYKAIGFQGHPEMSDNIKMHAYCRSLVDFYLYDGTPPTDAMPPEKRIDA